MTLPFTTAAPLGLRHDEPDHEYRKSGCLGSTMLKDYLQSPDGFRHRYVDKRPEFQFPGNKGTADGVAVHLKCQGDKYYRKAFTVIPDEFMTPGGQVSKAKAAVEWMAAAPGRCITKDVDAFYAFLHERIMANPIAVRLLLNSWNEVTGRIIDKVTGLPVQVRWDVLHPEWAADIKTTNAPINVFKYAVRDYSYLTQAALYTSVGASIIGKVLPFYWIVISTTYPFECRVIEAPERLLTNALLDIDRALKGIAAEDWGQAQGEPEVFEP